MPHHHSSIILISHTHEPHNETKQTTRTNETAQQPILDTNFLVSGVVDILIEQALCHPPQGILEV